MMNGKKAKELRGFARMQTQGLAETRYAKREYKRPIRLLPDCTRYVYQQLKRAYKAAGVE